MRNRIRVAVTQTDITLQHAHDLTMLGEAAVLNERFQLIQGLSAACFDVLDLRCQSF